MKKLKTLLCTMMAACGLMASAEPFTVTVNVDDASHVKCTKYENGDIVEIQPEGNSFVFNLTESTYDYSFTAVEPWSIKEVLDSDGYKASSVSGGTWSPGFYSAETYTMTTYNLDEARTGSYTVNVDHADMIMMKRGDYSVIKLVDGVNTINFDPTQQTETIVRIESIEYNKPLYKVSIDGNDLTANYGEYSGTIQQGSVVDIACDFPDLPATVKFSYNNGGEGCITNVQLDGEPVEDFDGKQIDCRVGQVLSFDKTKNWNISSYSVNGKSSSYFSSYNGVVVGDMEFSFIAQYDDPSIAVNINIDDASHVTLTKASGEVIPLVNGDNVVKVDRYSSIEMSPVAPWAIKEVLNLETGNPKSLIAGKWNEYITSGTYNYKVTTYNLDESRTATATVNVDDAERVLFRRESDNAVITLQNGQNIIKFNPETETVFGVSSRTNTPLYEVTLNDQAVSATYGTHTLNFTDNCVVDITAIIPDIDITASFVYNDEGFGCVSEVFVNDVKVEDFDGKTLALKAGQQVKLRFDKLFVIDSFAIDGKPGYIYSGSDYAVVLMDNTKFEFSAHKVGTIKATIKVDDPSNIIFGTGGYNIEYGATKVELQAGDNEIELPENNTMICWKAANGCFIESVDINGTVQSEYTTSSTLKEGDVVTFTTGKIVYDMKAIVWIDNKEAADSYFSMNGNYNDRTSLEVATGYNEVAFRQEMLPIQLGWYGSAATVGEVYINGELVQPQYQGSTSYSLDMKDGDVVKIFLSTTPVKHTVAFDVEEGIEVAATTDRIVAVEDLTQALSVFAGTEVAFTAESDEQLVVKNGETELTPGEDGKYLVTVDGETSLSVKKFQKGEFAVALDQSELTLVEETTATLTATITKGDDVTVETQEFTSSDAAVATVSAEGVITAVAQGKATITLTATDNYGRTATATCEVTVTEKSGIAEIEAANGAATIYDLQGRRVNKAGHGLYIVNGRKVRL